MMREFAKVVIFVSWKTKLEMLLLLFMKRARFDNCVENQQLTTDFILYAADKCSLKTTHSGLSPHLPRDLEGG